MTDEDKPDAFYHGTKAQLNPGDLIAPGFAGNYADRKQNIYVYLTGTLEATISMMLSLFRTASAGGVSTGVGTDSLR